MEENRYMAKMRVHELAKELNIKSQEVIDTLNGTQFAVKNVQSGLEAVSYTHLTLPTT